MITRASRRRNLLILVNLGEIENNIDGAVVVDHLDIPGLHHELVSLALHLQSSSFCRDSSLVGAIVVARLLSLYNKTQLHPITCMF